MQKTRQIIAENQEAFPRFAEYYSLIIEKIEKNIEPMPDVAIESCKALIEGVSKTILKYYEVPFKENGRSIDSPKDLLKKAMDRISKDTTVDDAILQKGRELVERIMQIRNDRGDISHGRAAPKDDCSEQCLAEAIEGITDGLVFYLLSCFFLADKSYRESEKYEAHPEFNQYLDDDNPIEGILYSKALYDQDPVAYQQQLENYLFSD